MTPAQRCAGAILVLGSILMIAAEPYMTRDEARSVPIAAVLADLGLGAMLLAGQRAVVPWVQFRTVLGVLLAIVAYGRDGPIGMALQLAYTACLAALLFRSPGRVRMVTATAALVGLLGLTAAGLFEAPIQRYLDRNRPPFVPEEVASIDDAVLTGDRFRYAIARPGGEWQRRLTDLARADNPLADLWLVHPAHDANLIVVAEKQPGDVPLSADQLVARALEQARQRAADLTVVSEAPLERSVGEARFLEAKIKGDGSAPRFYYGLFSAPGRSVQVIGFAPAASFPLVMDELRGAIESFRFEPDGVVGAARASAVASPTRTTGETP